MNGRQQTLHPFPCRQTGGALKTSNNARLISINHNLCFLLFLSNKHSLADQYYLFTVRYCFDPEFHRTAHIRRKSATKKSERDEPLSAVGDCNLIKD